MPRIRGGEDREVLASGTGLFGRRRLLVVIALLVLTAAIGVGVASGAEAPTGGEGAPVGESPSAAPEPIAAVPTAEQTEEVLEGAIGEEPEQGPETDPQVAEELPHRDLDGEEALELAEGVFGTELEEPAGIYDEFEPTRFLSDYAAVVPAPTLPQPPAEAEAGEPQAAEAPGPSAPPQPVLVESTLPLRTKNAEGEEEAVDLGLQSPEGSGGELQPQNPLTELTIPAHLGEGIELGGIGIELVGAAPESAPTNVEGQYAFYPNVAENTDLVVAPTPTGAETLTDIRSAQAPTTTTYRLSLPPGASLESDPGGVAEVVQGGRRTMLIPPPSAIDAAGATVPATMQVEGDELAVSISPGPSTQFPVMVDPNVIVEETCWSGCPAEGFAGWTGSTTNSSYEPIPYAWWDPSHYHGLDLTSGFPGPAYSGTHADWSYWVPRYSQDMTRYGTPPSTYVLAWFAHGVLFLPFGHYENYPAMVIGLIELGVGWAPEAWVHYGGQGELAKWETEWVINRTYNPAIKGADENLVTYEYEPQAKYRDTFIGSSTIDVFDPDAPRILELTAPKGWVTGTSAAIGYGFEDTGLGVWSSGIGLPGEVPLHKGWGAAFGCTGTNASPCPRVVRSSEAGAPALTFVPDELPTGEDHLEVVVGDPLWEEGHHASGNVTVKVDNTAPEVTLSGALTEQEKLGITKTEYPLTIKATDGTEADPQSGVAKVEVKVDGKSKQSWNPGCASGKNCSFSGSWTLKTSEFTAAAHEVEVLVTDAAGLVTSETVEVDLGEAPPQTSFTSPHPSHETTDLETIAFKATRGGTPVEGATFRCSLDGSAATPCTSPYTLPVHFETGPHTFTVAAVDKAGKADPTPATWRFETNPYPAAPPNEKLVFPETGQQTASYYTLEAEWGANPEGKAGEGVTGVTFQMQLPGNKITGTAPDGKVEFVPNKFETVPAECTIDGQGHQVSWPLPARTHPGHNAPVYLRVRGCPVFEHAALPYPEKEIQFRAVFDGSKAVAGASTPATTEFVYRANANRVATDATESVGPASVDLLTGSFTMSRTDVSIPVPGYEANLEFTRTYSSTVDSSLKGYSMVLGGAWQPGSPLESESEGQAWSRIVKQVILEHPAVYDDECWNEEEETVACAEERCNGNARCEEWEKEPFQPHEEWIELFNPEGAAVIFEITAAGNFVAPEYAKELELTASGGNMVLSYPNGSRNIFEPDGTNEWKPKFVTFQATPSSMRLVYENKSGDGMQLVREIAPAPEPIKCDYFGEGSLQGSEYKQGCRTLKFEYHKFEIPYHMTGGDEKLVGITYYGPSGSGVGVKVAEYTYKLSKTTQWPGFGQGSAYSEEEMLVSEKDPRLPLPVETYSYDETPGFGNLLARVTPPGQEPWGFEYEYGTAMAWPPTGKPSRLKALSRAGAKTTLAYGVPTHGSGAPYAMGSEDIARWGQTDLPVDATAIFPPNHVPSEYPPHEYTGATIHYMDPEGHEVNTASPSPPGVSGASISTTETDMKGNVVRELSPRNRLTALESAESAALSHKLDSHSVFNAAGTEMLESWGPLHQVRLESTGEVQARRHTVIRYDEGAPPSPAGTPPAYLPTKETVAAVVPGKEGLYEPHVTETKYEWAHRLPEETIVDPTGLNIKTVTKYNTAGQVEETRQPKGVAGGTAGDTRTVYYVPGNENSTGECVSSRYANLPCQVLPAAQASGTGRKQLPVKKFLAYNNLNEPTEVTESPGGGAAEVRKTTAGYDEAGRPTWTKVTGGGTPLARTEARTETVYSPTLGLPTEQKFVCEGDTTEVPCPGSDNQATTTTYNKLGQVTSYVDADGAKTETKYDGYGRPVSVTDPKGTQTLHYDETSGLVTSMEVSGIGTFTAAYDADGNLIRRGLPNGLTATTTYDQADQPVQLSYTKTSSCGKSCTWYEETLERSAEGRILYGTSTLVNDQYRYDEAGRLVEAQETPAKELPEEGKCTSREYKYDTDSNRLTKTTRSTGVVGPCGGIPESVNYGYDNADRLEGPTYDAWGRITTLPAGFAGGKELKTTYFANDMVATQTQNNVTNTFQLDATGRQRQREQAGGVAGIEIFHYDGPGDSTSWTSLGSTWSRNVPGIGGELAAVQESNGTTTTTTFKLTDLHGDAVASASSSPTAEKLLATFRFSEFGEPVSSGGGRFGWLGGKSRRTELASGVIQMGARSYIPQLGRFLTPDPVPGGSANAYDYSNQDPVNSSDPTGLKPYGRNPGFIGAGIHIWSPKGRKGGTHGTMKVRLFTRMECHTCGPTDGIGGEVHVGSVKVTIERGVGSGNIVGEHSIKSPTLKGEMPWTWENWNKGPPIEFGCRIGQEYKVTLTVVIDTTFGRTESESVSAEEVCGHGRY